jgi:formate hydrogenlyase transcriptional activator
MKTHTAARCDNRRMASAIQQPVAPPAVDCAEAAQRRAQLLIDVSKAINRHLDLGHVLDALAGSLAPLVAFNAIAVDLIQNDRIKLHSLTLKDFPRIDGESLEQLVGRFMNVSPDEAAHKMKGYPLSESRLSVLKRGDGPYVCEDLLSGSRYAEEEAFLGYGVLSYICLPLWKRDKLLGALYFNLNERRRFTEEEVQLIVDAGEIMTIAVINALAFEMIKSLKEKLQEENLLLQDEIVRRSMYEEIVGSSEALLAVLKSIDRVAPTDSTVLITGETGTGKELLARAIHRRSPRAGRTLVKVNCASMPAELIASELFGHEKGAFTGALQQRIGRFETADGGTIFLDEIGELAPDMQVALLRVLQEKEFERVGSNTTRHTDVRVIAATNRDLAAEVAAGRFRRDLFYRLNVFPVHSPPLRGRRDDIPVLVEYFVSRFAKRMGKRIQRIDRANLDCLQRYAWPGNIRELQNVIERAVILSDGEVLRLDSSSFPVDAPCSSSAPAAAIVDPRAQIENLLRETRGRISGAKGAAALLGIPASTLESRIRALGINKHAFKNGS